MTADYSDPILLDAIHKYIAALGNRYDGDRRLFVIHPGLLGFWYVYESRVLQLQYPWFLTSSIGGSSIVGRTILTTSNVKSTFIGYLKRARNLSWNGTARHSQPQKYKRDTRGQA